MVDTYAFLDPGSNTSFCKDRLIGYYWKEDYVITNDYGQRERRESELSR